MILFPLVATWMWFQIITASPLVSSDRRVEDTSDAQIFWLSISCVI